MEISDNKSLYTNTNYKKTKKLDSTISIEVFQIDKSDSIEIKNINTNKMPDITENYIYDNIKNDLYKDTRVYYWAETFDEAYAPLKNKPDEQSEWWYQNENATFGNIYEDAKDFENFIAKWIKKGDTEADALERAVLYARAGLLDYGKQKAIEIAGLEYDDKKLLETLDSLDIISTILLVDNMFPVPGYTNISSYGVSSSFKELLEQYGIKLEDLKKQNPNEENSKFTFTGDININDKMSLEYQNFIFDTLIGFFKDRIHSLDTYIDDMLQYKEEIDTLKNAYDTLIENFKKNTKEYNETKNILNQYMKS